jgi:hypothetical protein
MDLFGVVRYADYDMNIDLNEINEQTYDWEGMDDFQIMGLDDNEGMDFNFDNWLDNGTDFMQNSIDLDMFLDIPSEQEAE